MENNNNNPQTSKGKDNYFKAEIPFYETVIKTEYSEPQRIVIVANLVWIKDKNGNVRETEQGTQYKVNIQDGQISFNKPLKFKDNG